MKQSTAKFIRNMLIGLFLIGMAAIIFATCHHHLWPTLVGAVLAWVGIVWIGCGATAKWRKCRQLTGYDEPLDLEHNPMSLDCPPNPCCCGPQPESGNADNDDPEVGCGDIVRCEL